MAFFDPRRPAYLDNPYPALTELRRSAPVHWSPDLRGWVVTRFADCAQVLQETSSFSARLEAASPPVAARLDPAPSGAPLAGVTTLSSSDGEEHLKLRRLASGAFTAAATDALDPLIEARARALLCRVPHGRFDLMEAFADPLARDVGLMALGVPDADLDEFWRWVARIEFARSRPATPQAVAAAEDAVAALEAYLPALPVSSALGSIWQHAGDLGREIALSVVVQVAAVGSGPTAGAIANGLVALTEHPEQEAEIGDGLAEWVTATDEFLRYDSPAHAVTRFAAIDAELGGRRIRAGSPVYVMIGSANRDDTVFPDADRFDVRRDARRQMSFGHGGHFCLGARLARRSIAHALRALRLHLPGLRLVGLQRNGSFELRMPERLLVAAG